MVHFALLATLASAAVASAASIPTRRAEGLTDPDILNFALTLEHLEATFYADALKNYTEDQFKKEGFGGVRDKIQMIADDEAQHVDFLTAGLKAAGATPVGASKYNFPSTDVKSFLGLAQILEGVGVSAYLGAAPAIASKEYLGAAGSILTVEARHNAFIRYVNNKSPFPGPEDAALSPRSVVSLAAAFFAPGAPNAPSIKPFPALTVGPAGQSFVAGSTVSVKPAEGASNGKYCAFISGLMAGFSDYKDGNCVVPSQNVTAGQTYVLLTSSQAVSDDAAVAGPAIIAVNPTKKN